MDQNLQLISRKVWNMVRIAYYMLRKGIFKSKLMADLSNLISKRRKITGKALKNLVFHHDGPSAVSTAAGDYEFSCSNSPAFPALQYFNKRRHFFACAHAPNTLDDDEVAAMAAFKAVMGVLKNDVVASPALPGFGRSPMVVPVRQLRVTDSPFPMVGAGDEDSHVDKAAEEFINRFYKELRLQE